MQQGLFLCNLSIGSPFDIVLLWMLIRSSPEARVRRITRSDIAVLIHHPAQRSEVDQAVEACNKTDAKTTVEACQWIKSLEEKNLITLLFSGHTPVAVIEAPSQFDLAFTNPLYKVRLLENGKVGYIASSYLQSRK